MTIIAELAEVLLLPQFTVLILERSLFTGERKRVGGVCICVRVRENNPKRRGFISFA